MSPESSVGSLGEDAAIALVARVLAYQELPAGWVGIGDDAAVTTVTPGRHALTTTDLLVEGVHFRRSTTGAFDLGWKAIAVNASDIAGMGGEARWATVSLALPEDVPAPWLADFYRGVRALSRGIGLAIVGGDTVLSPGPLMVAVTVVGEAERPMLRTGAEPGYRVLVTGTLGASAAGLWALEHPELTPSGPPMAFDRVVAAHRRPVPHLAEGRLLAGLAGPIAMMDDSDGLARSVCWLAEANGLAIEVAADQLPIDDATRAVAAAAGVAAWEWGLYGGEDYGLVALVPEPEAMAIVAASRTLAHPVAIVGECREGSGVTVRQDGTASPIDARRIFHHFSGG